jgi:ATP-dependent Clp protease ATP-binding subunit ClpX
MLEGTVVSIVDKSGNAPSHRRGGVNGNIPMGSGGSPSAGGGAKGESYSVDTSNILFILSGAFIGLDKTVKDRIAKGVSKEPMMQRIS